MAISAQRPLRVTERLKQARESRGLSHRQLAEVTKMSTRVVAALEDGKLDLVPAGVYRRSLVRLIASELGLPPEDTLRAFLAEHPDDLTVLGGSPIEATLSGMTATRAPGRWRRALAMLGATVPLLVGIVYFARPIVSHAPTDASRPAPSTSPLHPQTEVVPTGGFMDVPPAAASPVTMLITISDRCVLRVVADGSAVVGRAFEAGESFRVAFSDAVELSGDNAGVVQFSINGRAGRVLGREGELLSVRIGRDDYSFWLSGR